jgi:cysteine-rich repeat protein
MCDMFLFLQKRAFIAVSLFLLICAIAIASGPFHPLKAQLSPPPFSAQGQKFLDDCAAAGGVAVGYNNCNNTSQDGIGAPAEYYFCVSETNCYAGQTPSACQQGTMCSDFKCTLASSDPALSGYGGEGEYIHNAYIEGETHFSNGFYNDPQGYRAGYGPGGNLTIQCAAPGTSSSTVTSTASSAPLPPQASSNSSSSSVQGFSATSVTPQNSSVVSTNPPASQAASQPASSQPSSHPSSVGASSSSPVTVSSTVSSTVSTTAVSSRASSTLSTQSAASSAVSTGSTGSVGSSGSNGSSHSVIVCIPSDIHSINGSCVANSTSQCPQCAPHLSCQSATLVCGVTDYRCESDGSFYPPYVPPQCTSSSCTQPGHQCSLCSDANSLGGFCGQRCSNILVNGVWTWSCSIVCSSASPNPPGGYHYPDGNSCTPCTTADAQAEAGRPLCGSASSASSVSSRQSSSAACPAKGFQCGDCVQTQACICNNAECWPEAAWNNCPNFAPGQCSSRIGGQGGAICGNTRLNGTPTPFEFPNQSICTPCTSGQAQSQSAACAAVSAGSTGSNGSAGSSVSSHSGSSQSSNSGGSKSSNGSGGSAKSMSSISCQAVAPFGRCILPAVAAGTSLCTVGYPFCCGDGPGYACPVCSGDSSTCIYQCPNTNPACANGSNGSAGSGGSNGSTGSSNSSDKSGSNGSNGSHGSGTSNASNGSSSSNGAMPCTSNNQCPVGQQCLNNSCTAGCTSNTQCPSGDQCANTTCTPACSTTAQCPSGQQCVSGSCTPSCSANNQCPSGGCVDGVCTQSCNSNTQCPSGDRCIDGSCTSTCTNSNQCPNNEQCISGSCSPTCTNTSQCPTGDQCVSGSCSPIGFCCLGNICGTAPGCTNLNCNSCGTTSTSSHSSTSSARPSNCPVDACNPDGQAFCSNLPLTPVCNNISDLPCIVCTPPTASRSTSSSSSSTSSQIPPHICGNNIREYNEECDDGNLNNDDGCSSTCLLEGGTCGDNIIESRLGETCEPSLTDPSTNCDQNCHLLSSASSNVPQICGDNRREGTEECDDGNRNGTDTSPCNTSCQLTFATCGDGIVETRLHEECEPSLMNPNSLVQCSSSCRYIYTIPHLAASEFSANSTSSTTNACSGTECQNGGSDFCSAQAATCTSTSTLPCIICNPLNPALPPFVPTSFKPTSSHSSSHSSSSRSSKHLFIANANCGNGIINPGEQCDDGPQNSANPNAFCRPDCTFGRCGDGVMDTPLETCDDGSQNGLPTSTCTQTCRNIHDPTQVLPATAIELPFTGTPPPTTLPSGNQTTASLVSPSTPTPPSNTSSGPETLVLMAAGASAGYAWMKRRRVKVV